MVKLTAVASFECCRAVDECLFDIINKQDLDSIYEELKMWHGQWKRVSLWVTLHLKEDITEPQLQPEPIAQASTTRCKSLNLGYVKRVC